MLIRQGGRSNGRGVAVSRSSAPSSDDAVVALSHDECQCGVDLLTSKVVDASIDNDPTAERLMQKNLARALLRWSQINRGTPHVEHDAATGHGDEEGAGESSGGMFR